MTDLLEETLRDHQYERQVTWFRNSLLMVIATTFIVVVSMAIYNYLTTKKMVAETKATNQLLLIDNYLKTDETLAEEILDQLIQANPIRIVELAELQRVGLMIKHQQLEQAATSLMSIADNIDYSLLSQSYARLLWLNLILQLPLTTIDHKKVEDYLHFFDKEDSLFKGASSIIASLWSIKNQQFTKAKELLTQVVDILDVPVITKAQAQGILLNLEAQNK